jgi:transcriptional regulator with XRE-family HTH domain
MGEQVGPELRAARLSQRKSLRSVASAVGVSASLLSQVETGKTQPSVSTLYALVSHLGLSLDELMGISAGGTDVVADQQVRQARSAEGAFIQRAADNPVLEMDNGVRWERLAVDAAGEVNPLLVTYPAGATSSLEGRLMRHSGTEYALIIEGELTLQLEFNRYTLYAGDSLCFDSSRPHLFLNASTRTCRGVWFNLGRHDLEHTRPQVTALRAELGLGGQEPPVSAQSAVDILAAIDRIG